MKVLVTGASGRLGPHVVKALEDAGHNLVLTSRRPVPEGIAHWPWIQADIREYDECARVVGGQGFDAIHHLAAQPNPVDHPSQRKAAEEKGIPFDATMRSNIMGTYYLLQAALHNDIEIFVPMAGLIDVDKELSKLNKEKDKLDKEIKRTSGKLSNEKFLNNAPADVVAKEKEKLATFEAKLEKIEENKKRLKELA